MIQSFAACRTYHFLLPIPATTYSASVRMAWGTLKTSTHKRLQSWPYCWAGEDTKPSSRSFEQEAKSVKKQRNKKSHAWPMIQLVHSKFHPNLRHLFFRPNDLHHEPGKTNSPSSVLEEHKANPLGFNMWALPIVEVILPQSWDLKAMVSQATFCLGKIPTPKRSPADILPTTKTRQRYSGKIYPCQATNGHQRFQTSTPPAWRLFNEDPSQGWHQRSRTNQRRPANSSHLFTTLLQGLYHDPR